MGYTRIITGVGNHIGKGSDRLALINCHYNTVEPGTSGITAMNCSGFAFTHEHNHRTVVENRIVVSNKSTSIGASVSTTVNGIYGMYYCDGSGGNVTVNMPNPAQFVDAVFTFKKMDNTGSSVDFNAYNSENLEFVAGPYSGMTTKGNCITWTTDGTDWFIKMT